MKTRSKRSDDIEADVEDLWRRWYRQAYKGRPMTPKDVATLRVVFFGGFAMGQARLASIAKASSHMNVPGVCDRYGQAALTLAEATAEDLLP